ncbi:hypothetical protein [Microcoleus sp. CAWBG58]|uniref:hypothetical protein n=1 Tax=Microcoleus sp. CAWBG58 TaxID=2841651 RepID=UPI0025DA302E|nr:hypothetical protein [Microcoleus sp. CAWBG58]
MAQTLAFDCFFLLLTVNCQLSTVNCQLSTVNCQLSTVNCQLSTVNCQLSTVNCQLSTVNCHGMLCTSILNRKITKQITICFMNICIKK